MSELIEKIEEEINEEINEEIDKEARDEEVQDYTILADASISQYSSQIGFKTLVQGFDTGLYVIPKYQRQYVWSQDQVQNLAVSLVRGLPIPPIYCYRNKKGQLEILDGQQRMLAFFLYYQNKYLKNRNIPINLRDILNDAFEGKDDKTVGEYMQERKWLKEVTYQLTLTRYVENLTTNEKESKEEIIDITYKNLPLEIKRRLDYTAISVVEIRVDQSDHMNNKRIYYKIFSNLNNEGTRLQDQEIRNGVYECEFYDMLHEINDTNAWRNYYGEKDRHSKDIEYLLKLCALKYYATIKDDEIILKEYTGNNKKLLNDFSDKCIKFNNETIAEYRKSLNEFIHMIPNSLTKQNKLLIEALFVAKIFTPNMNEIPERICFDILQRDEYKKTSGSATASKENVGMRLNYVYKQLRDELEKY